jgi:prefoldin subunit 5
MNQSDLEKRIAYLEKLYAELLRKLDQGDTRLERVEAQAGAIRQGTVPT